MRAYPAAPRTEDNHQASNSRIPVEKVGPQHRSKNCYSMQGYKNRYIWTPEERKIEIRG